MKFLNTSLRENKMTSKIATLTAAAALALAPAVAFGQTATPDTVPGQMTNPPAVSPVAPDAGVPHAPNAAMPHSSGTADAGTTMAPSSPKFVSAQASGQWLGTDIIGTEVVNPGDEKLGSISNLIVESDGTIIAAIIDVGGFLGIGAKPVAVSFDSIQMRATDSGRKAVVALAKEELNSAPQFKTLEELRSEAASAGSATN